MADGSELPDPATRSLWVYPARHEEKERADVWNKDHGLLRLPAGWEFLESGDQFVTRAVKKLGPTWLLCKNDPRRRITRKLGVYAPAEYIRKAEALARQTEADREKGREKGARLRARQEERYRGEFRLATLKYLDFASRHAALAEEIAESVATRACMVGSGRVGRTSLLPLEAKVTLAVCAHLRHNITRYDDALFEHSRANEAAEVDRETRLRLKREARQHVEAFLRRHRQSAVAPKSSGG